MNKLVVVLIFAALAGAVLGCTKSNIYRTVKSEEFARIISGKDMVQILDVRSLAEFNEGHLKDALLIDIASSSFLTEAGERLNKKQTVALYCRGGKRSAKAAAILAAEGFDVVNLDGGILEWIKGGREIVK